MTDVLLSLSLGTERVVHAFVTQKPSSQIQKTKVDSINLMISYIHRAKTVMYGPWLLAFIRTVVCSKLFVQLQTCSDTSHSHFTCNASELIA